MKTTEEMKKVFENAAGVTLITMNADGTPHPIIAGKGEVTEDAITFGIYKMEVTQKNLKANPKAYVVAASMQDGPKGYRFTGKAEAQGKQLIFTPVKAEELI